MALTPSNPGQVSPPNDLTEQGTGSVAIPNDLTEQSAGSVAIPNNLTEQSAGSVAIPNNLTEQSAGSVAIPNELSREPTTNLITYSQFLQDNTAWIKNDSQILAVGSNLPFPADNDSLSLCRFQANSTGTINPRISQTVTGLTAGERYTLSFFARASNERFVQVYFGTGEIANDPRINFDFFKDQQSITAQDADILDAKIYPFGESNGGEVARASCSFIPTGTSLTIICSVCVSGTKSRGASESFTNGEGLYVSGFQLEQTQFETSYLKTEATAPLTEGQLSIPNNLTEQAVGTIPRTLDPILKLDFENEVYETTSNQGLDDIVTYSRNSSASFWNRRQDEQGRWETYIDTDYVGSVTNLFTYSEDYTQADWEKLSCTATASNTIDYFGNTAYKIETTGANAFPYLRQTPTVSAGLVTFSAIVKKGNNPEVYLRINGTGIGGGADTSTTFSFNFDSQAFTNYSGYALTEYFSNYLGDGWYEFGLSVEVTTVTSCDIRSAYNTTDILHCYVARTQITESAKLLPYVVTTTTSASDTFVESPRLEYDPITAEPLGYLAEGASTNIALRSEEFDNATWQKGNSSISTANAGIAPDGTKSADLFDEGVATSTHYVFQGVTLSASTVYTLSYFVKPITITEINVILQDSANFNNRGQVYFDLTGVGSVGTITNAGDFTATDGEIELVNNGWYRVSITTTTGSATSNLARISSRDGADSYTGTNREMLLWGAMLEELPFTSSYIRTEGATVARSIDAMNADQTNGGTGETFKIVARTLGNLSTSMHLFSYGSDGSNYIGILQQASTAEVRVISAQGGSLVTNFVDSTILFTDDYQDAVLTLETDNNRSYVNGELRETDTNAQNADDISGNLSIGARLDDNSSTISFAHIKLVSVYDQYLNASEVALGDSLSGITEAVIPALSAPNNLTEQSVGAVAIPNNLTEQTVGSVAIPNDLTEQAVSAFPRTFAPLLNLDFANEIYATNDEPSALDDIVTYTRNSSASFWNRRIGRNGKYETFLDTDYVGSVTNLALHSEDFNQADWVKTLSTINLATGENSPPNTTAPVYKLASNATATQASHVGDVYTLSSGTWYTFSIKVKVEEVNAVQIFFGSGNVTTNPRVNFDLVSGAMGDTLNENITQGIKYLGDQWYEIHTTFLTAATTVGIYLKLTESLVDGRAATISLNEGDGVFITQAQLTESTKPLPYVKTLSTSASETFVETPRLEYDPITAQPLGYLAEGASTNLITASEVFSVSPWSLVRSTVTDNDSIAPDGTKSADKLVEDGTASNTHRLGISVAGFTSGQQYTYSIYAKKSERTQLQLRFSTGAFPSNCSTVFDLDNLTTVDGAGVDSSKVYSVGNGWYRCELQGTANATGATAVEIYLASGGVTSYDGDGSSGLYIFGAQVEELPFASSYIRTDGGTVQRVNETLQLSSGIVNEARQSITLRAIHKQTFLPDTQRFIMSINLDGSGQSFLSSTTGNEFRHRNGETASSTNFTLTANNVDQFYESVLTFNGSQSRLFVNGEFDISNADVGGDVTLSNIAINIGTNEGGSNVSHWYGHIKLAVIYDEALTDQEVSLL